LTISRDVEGGPEEVFRAMTEPAELMRWWGGDGGLTRAHVNLRPGGEYRLDFEMPLTPALSRGEREKMPLTPALSRGEREKTGWVKGQYHAVEAGKRIVMTWFSSIHPDLRNDVELRFEPAGTGAARVTVVHSGLAGQPEILKEYEGVWNETLDRLASKTKRRN
jgi:uncharacterized protein YndB with AHSA1/START domain